ncbi:response regulator [Roseovarius aestuarii]|uniref:Sensor histidine kinase RcsC n=1 Tax=Roseovarius aestuarii TaxID=475083 RepID=A0A1X7BSS4_9RHOB|nr:response regulator [Roseovarius aestuarii]SMC12259.1 Sensor histidine kinase RcsC [Roseovarius aestuarii]
MPKDVLVVEDDELSQFVIVEMCRELGFRCLTADGGREAIDIATANADTIGVVLMDLHMPEVSGLTATKAIRSTPSDPPKNIPIVATTADIHWHSARRCLEYGFNSVLPKPLNFDDLSAILGRFAA